MSRRPCARHALWLEIAPLKSGNTKHPRLEKSAIGHVLNGGQPFATAGDIWEALRQLRGDCSAIRIESAPPPLARTLAAEQIAALDPARSAPTTRAPFWWIASYSSLRIVARDETRSDDAYAPAISLAPTALPQEREAYWSYRLKPPPRILPRRKPRWRASSGRIARLDWGAPADPSWITVCTPSPVAAVTVLSCTGSWSGRRSSACATTRAIYCAAMPPRPRR